MSRFEDLKYEILSQIEISNLSDRTQRVQQIIMSCSGLSAGVAIQPLPFADFPLFTFIEAVMVMKL